MLFKVLFNASTNFKGGGVQTASNFIKHTIDDALGVDWHYAVSDVIYENLKSMNVFPCNMTVFFESPARSLKMRRRMKEHADAINPSLVYTMSGPAYVNFSQRHLLGCSNPYITHPNEFSFSHNMSLIQRIMLKTKVQYQCKWVKRGDYWIFQTEAARNGFIKRMRIQKERTFVVPNALSSVFYNRNIEVSNNIDGEFIIFVPTAYYRHKNLEILPSVASEIKKKLKEADIRRDFRLLMTIPPASRVEREIFNEARRLGVAEHIVNRGPFLLSEGPALYKKSNLMFMPTLLETFSASYLEAMISGCPIVTTDLDFARDICRDAADYFSPLNAAQAAETIMRLMEDDKHREMIIQKGYDRIKEFPTIEKRYQMIVNILEKIHAEGTMQ